MDTVTFLEQLCKEADAERKAGNWGKMNVIASNPGVKYYFDNVYKLGVAPKSFEYTGYFQEAKAFFEAYQAQAQQAQTVTETAARMTALESKLDQLLTLVKPLVESQTTTEDAPADPAPKKRTKKSQDPEEPEAPADTDAEEDSDSDESDTEA